MSEAKNKASELTRLLYAERDPMELDEAGNYYFRHVSAMTGEGLHSKAAIAAELGQRDWQIDQLKYALGQCIKVMEKNIYPKPDVKPDHPFAILCRARDLHESI